MSILTWIFVFSMNAADLSYPVYPMKAAPAMNGKWDCDSWKDIPVASGFIRMQDGKFLQIRQTSFRMGWYGRDLYVAVKCEEPELDSVTHDKNNYRDGWYPDDHLEFFFSKSLAHNLKKQFVINSNAARWCNFVTHGDSNKWSASAFKGKHFWSVVFKIPFDLLDLDDNFTTGKFYFNLARMANNNPAKDKLSCYAPVKNGFGDIPRFVELSFRPHPDAAASLAAQKRLNKLEKWQRTRLWKMANTREAFFDNSINSESLKALSLLKQQAGKILASKNLENASDLINEYDKIAQSLSVPVKKLVMELHRKNADVKLFLNGKLLKSDGDGNYPLVIEEGFSVLAAECHAVGKDPGVSMKLKTAPETDFRWKYSIDSEKDWNLLAFSDKKWNAVANKDGFLWSRDPNAKKVYMRQVILWNKSHDGPNRCINPLVRVWGFSKNSTEAIFLALYQAIKGNSDQYVFVLDLPEGFRLLDMKHNHPDGWWGSKVNMNCVPVSVTENSITRSGQKFVRYTLTYRAEDIRGDKTLASILPVKAESTLSIGKKYSFYFRRMAEGNFTELEQILPVEVLPEIKGKMPKAFMLSNYCSQPYFGAHLSDEALKEVMETAFSAGFNTWIVQPNNAKVNPYFDLFQNMLKERNVRRFAHRGNYPAWRGSIWHGDALRSFVDTVPAAKARYFNGRNVAVSPSTNLKTVKENWNQVAMYCPTYVTTEGRGKFVELVSQDLKKSLASLGPDLYGYWINWESEPWQNGNAYLAAKTGVGSYCFCEKCKKAFYSTIKLPAGKTLSDEDIYRKYYNEWKSFRYSMDGKIQELIAEACHKLNLKYMVYSWVNQDGFWLACKDRIDLAFSGCPGNAPADSIRQEVLDRSMKFFREKLGLQRVMGQRFVFFSTYYSIGENGWKNYTVMSPDGYINAKSWKSQILRIAASMHGGVDMQSPMECVAGIMYYFGEAARAITDYEDLFLNGTREDTLAVSPQIKYPNLLVLRKGKERLVLLFNEENKPIQVELENREVKDGASAEIWGTPGVLKNPKKLKLTIPAEDVVLLHIQES